MYVCMQSLRLFTINEHIIRFFQIPTNALRSIIATVVANIKERYLHNFLIACVSKKITRSINSYPKSEPSVRSYVFQQIFLLRDTKYSTTIIYAVKDCECGQANQTVRFAKKTVMYIFRRCEPKIRLHRSLKQNDISSLNRTM